MNMKQLAGALFLGDLFACDCGGAYEDEEADIPGDREAEDAKDGYLRYEMGGLPMHTELREGITSVGSSRKADCHVTGRNISGKQVIFRRKGDAYYVRNVSSKGQTLVNDKALKRGTECRIESGSTIRLMPDVLIWFLRRPKPKPGTKYGF